MINPTNLINEILGTISNERTKEIIARRFGLDSGQRQTLEAIGQDHGITRERVRQIEENGLNALRQANIRVKLQPIQREIGAHLKEHGDLKRESNLFNDMSYVCFPVKEIERMKQANDYSALGKCQSALSLIMTLGDDFERVPETDHFHTVWTTDKEAVKKAKKTVDSLVKHLEDKNQVLTDEQIFAVAKALRPDLSDKAVAAYVDASKRIEQNHLGHFGLAHWPEIKPRGVKDKAYIILKNEGKPLHFGEVTTLINKVLPFGRKAYVQTVHNELIKDSRFVLVGRGLYALAEWGYQPGTVAEIIRQVLKADGPMSKEEIIRRVLAKRLVKENTILINLQNHKLFERDDNGKYVLKA